MRFGSGESTSAIRFIEAKKDDHRMHSSKIGSISSDLPLALMFTVMWVSNVHDFLGPDRFHTIPIENIVSRVSYESRFLDLILAGERRDGFAAGVD